MIALTHEIGHGLLALVGIIAAYIGLVAALISRMDGDE
jgi:hypothetical protein